MKTYDLLDGSLLPSVPNGVFDVPYQFQQLRAEIFAPIRVTMDDETFVSAVYILKDSQGIGEIWLFGDEKTCPNGIPEHFTAVHEKAREYAAKAGIKRLRITYPNRGGVDFLKSKFPTWSVVPDALHPTVLSPL